MMRRIERQAQRYPAKLKVNTVNGRPVNDIFLLDISALGAKMESSTPLATRNFVEMGVLLTGAQHETKLAGMVIWIRPLMATPGRYLMGIEFHQRFWNIDQLGRAGKI
jgi:PilZ domain